MAGPLEGIKVVDITQGLAGPYCSMQLGDAGALVTKVEPLEGDYARGYAPPFIGTESAQFLALNRNKASIALDITHPEGRNILTRLIDDADVFLVDLTPKEIEQLGLGYENLAKANSRLIYCAITPFGEGGPLANQPGAELVIQAMADYTNSLGAIGEPPVRLGTDVANINTGVIAVQAVVAALFHRERTGEGQRVSVSLFGSLLHMRGMIWACQSEGVDDWWGFHQDTYVKPPDYGYRAKDGQVFLSMFQSTDESFRRLLDKVGLSEMAADPRWGNAGRDVVGGPSRYGWEVKEVWEEAIKDMSSREVIELFRQHGAVAVPVHDYNALFAHPQVAMIEMVLEVQHPSLGLLRMTGFPWKFSDTPAAVQGPAPMLGEHTDHILFQLGFTADEISRLKEMGVIR